MITTRPPGWAASAHRRRMAVVSWSGQLEPAGCRLPEHALARQVAKHVVQGTGVAVGRGRKIMDVTEAARDVFGDPQGSHHAQALESLQVGQRSQVPACLPGRRPAESVMRAS